MREQDDSGAINLGRVHTLILTKEFSLSWKSREISFEQQSSSVEFWSSPHMFGAFQKWNNLINYGVVCQNRYKKSRFPSCF